MCKRNTKYMCDVTLTFGTFVEIILKNDKLGKFDFDITLGEAVAHCDLPLINLVITHDQKKKNNLLTNNYKFHSNIIQILVNITNDLLNCQTSGKHHKRFTNDYYVKIYDTLMENVL